MFENFNSITNDYLNPVSVWIGIITAVPIFWTWYDVVWGRQSRYHRWVKEALGHTGSIPAILIIDLLPGKDMRTAVEHFRSQHSHLRDIPEERIFTVSYDTWLKPDDSTLIAQKIRDASAEILQCGADVVHCFYAGPVFAAALTGAEFANASCRIMLYQNGQDGNYINFGPLRHPAF